MTNVSDDHDDEVIGDMESEFDDEHLDELEATLRLNERPALPYDGHTVTLSNGAQVDEEELRRHLHFQGDRPPAA